MAIVTDSRGRPGRIAWKALYFGRSEAFHRFRRSTGARLVEGRIRSARALFMRGKCRRGSCCRPGCTPRKSCQSLTAELAALFRVHDYVRPRLSARERTSRRTRLPARLRDGQRGERQAGRVPRFIQHSPPAQRAKHQLIMYTAGDLRTGATRFSVGAGGAHRGNAHANGPVARGYAHGYAAGCHSRGRGYADGARRGYGGGCVPVAHAYADGRDAR